MMLTCLTFMLSLCFHIQASSQATPIDRIRLSFGSPGVKVEVVTTESGLPVESRSRLQAISGNTKKLLASVGDLKGYASITNKQDALRLVRLRTAYTTWYMWPDTRSELEVMTRDEVGSVPNFGLKDILPDDRSGYLGVLSARAFSAGGFTKATVSETSSGYRITRWVFVTDYVTRPPKQFLEFIQETVGKDGAYTRRVLKKKALPKLPATRWHVHEFA